ncbi:MAG TPA: hypothetical protein VIL98_06615 [Gaiellaceae bacterium]
MIVLLAALVAVAAPVQQQLAFERQLRPAGHGPVQLEPDGPMFAHARPGFPDLRIVDSRGEQVPWRPLPAPPAAQTRPLPVLDSGRRDGVAVARLDLGAGHAPVDHVTLQVPDTRFVGSATAAGSDDRRTWTRLSTTQIYAVGGAVPARSTTLVLPPTTFRYLEVRAMHVTRIEGATVTGTPRRPPLHRLPARVKAGDEVVVVDLRYRNVPIDQLRISSSTPRYARRFTVEVGGAVVAAGELVRVGRARQTIVPLSTRARIIRIRIENGDDPPLRGIKVEALARPRTLLVEGGRTRPLTIYYGGTVRAPSYDYARLPRSALALDRSRPGTLGAERPNPDYAVVDARSFFARHGSLVTLALVLAAAAVIGAAGLALRRR